MPNFTQLMKMSKEKVDDKVQLDLAELKKVVDANKNEIEAVEIYINNTSIIIVNAPDEAIITNL